MERIRKYIVFFLVSTCAASVNAQYVFTNCGSHPSFGDSLVGSMTEYDTAGVSSGSPGANVVWDFTGLTGTYTWPLSHYYFDPAATEGYYMFPTSDVADRSLGGVYSYLNYSWDSVIFMGDYHDSVNFHRSWDPQKQMFCNLSFGNSFTDYFSRYNFSQCPYHHTYSNRTVTYDGYGTLNVPGYSYSAARIKIVENTLDTAICVGPSIISGMIDTTYLWFDVNTGHPVFSWHYYYDTTHAYKNILVEHYLYSHLPQLTSGVKEDAVFGQIISVYPNPSNGKFTFKRSSDRNAVSEISVYNSLGERVFNSTDARSGSLIDISSEPDGIYFISVSTGKGLSSQKLVLSK